MNTQSTQKQPRDSNQFSMQNNAKGGTSSLNEANPPRAKEQDKNQSPYQIRPQEKDA